MRETDLKIKEYTAMLPRAKEKVLAAVFIVAITAAVLTTVTYAWFTLAWSPTVESVTTTISANGSLEIALSDVDGLEPEISAVGDSGLSITEKNLTWGNIINLSDDSYGFQEMTLRPASLDRNKLLTKPIYAAGYGEDGRLLKMNSDFAYANWYNDAENNNSYFLVPSATQYGVRAIAAVIKTDVGGDSAFAELSTEAESYILQASTQYQALMANPQYIAVLEDFIGAYGTAVMNKTLSSFDCKDYIPSLYLMMQDLYVSMQTAGNALLTITEMQQMIALGRGNYVAYATVDDLFNATALQMSQNGVSISVLTSYPQYKTDMRNIGPDLIAMGVYAQTANDGGSVMWSSVSPIINRLIDINNTTMNGKKISSLGVSDANSIMGNDSNKVLIPGGYLYNHEDRLGSYMNDGRGIDITAVVRYITSINVKANVKTTATGHLLDDDKSLVENSHTGSWQGGTPVAEDTYGFAVDFWVRTNAAASYLTLEGKLLTVTTQERATVDYQGQTYEVYSAQLSYVDAETGQTAYIKSDVVNFNGSWYTAVEDSPVDVTARVTGTPVAKYNEITTIIGYEGDNRIWQDDPNITKYSTSQGNGSCYTFYADSPTDLAQSLQLLEAIKVVFFNEEGNLLAIAGMDTENYFSLNGKVTVPLVLESSESMTVVDASGNEVKAITELERNVAMRITALVYLDGTKVTNDKVLAAADIQGQLNIQFGSTADLKPIGDEDLELAERHVSATIDKTSFDYELDAGNMSSVVTLTVDGDQPNVATATFIRAVNSSQGTREEEITFVKEGGVWKATKVFTLPGTYVLRNVRLDGIDFELDTALTVTITGFAVQSLTCPDCDALGKATLLTADSAIQTSVNLKFVTGDTEKMPSKVQAILINEDNVQSTVNLKIDSTTQIWSGVARFTTSGVYRLQYLKFDNEYFDIAASMQKEITVYVGLKTRVWIDNNHAASFDYLGPETLQMSAVIMDNTGEELTTVLSDVKLYYSQKGSSIKGVNSDMEWDSARQRYVGAFNITGPGTFVFSQLTVGSNTITKATYSPTIVSIPIYPIAYYDAQPMESLGFQYAPDNDATMSVRLAYSSAAEVYALIRNHATGNYYVSSGTMGTETSISGVPVTVWTFAVPKELGTQDGDWQLISLKAGSVYYDNVFYVGGEPITTAAQFNDAAYGSFAAIDLSGEDISSYVVCTVSVAFPEGQSRNFGAGTTVGYQNATGTFLQNYTISDLSVVIADKNGYALPNVTDVALSYVRIAGTEQTYGAYTSDHLTGVSEDEAFTIGFESADGINFTQTGTQTIFVAGEYVPTLSFKINGRSYSYGGTDEPALPLRTPLFSISSMRPTVTIVGTDPAPAETFNINLGSGSTDDPAEVHNYFESYFANCYIVYGGMSCSIPDYSPSQVTLKLTNSGSSYTNALFTLPNAADSAYPTAFTFTSDNSNQTGNVGGVDSSTRKTAGKQTISSVTMTSGSNQYTVTLSNPVTIWGNNAVMPSLTYTGLDDYSAYVTTPAKYSGDESGRPLTVVLPTLSDWTLNAELPSETGDTQTSSTTASVYTSRTSGSGCNAKTYYTPYTRTTTTERTTTVKQTCTVTYRLTGWKIGTKTYAPGATVTVSAVSTATAVYEEVSRVVISSVTSTLVEVYVQDVATAAESTTKPSGTSVTTIYTTRTKTSSTWE